MATDDYIDFASKGLEWGGAPGFYSNITPWTAFAAPLIPGVFGGVPSGKANIDALQKARQQAAIQPYLDWQETQIPAGMTKYEWMLSQRSPDTPIQQEIVAVYDSDEGDRDYEVDQVYQTFFTPTGAQTDYGAKRNAEWLKQDDNAKWYNPDMSRTDYAGEYAAPLSQQGLFGGGMTTKVNTPSAPTLTQGNIYGQGVPRQTYNGQDLYADQTLYRPTVYKGY